MGNLPNYINMGDYCEELCNITKIGFHEIESIVNAVFVSIAEGVIDAVDGLVYIDNILTLLVSTDRTIAERPAKLALALS